MTKKFDVVIGNPPYQEEAKGSSGRDEPIYHLFMEAAYEVGHKAVLITPARFLSNSGQTPSVWNKKMLNDPHLSVSVYEPDSKQIFSGADIKGGIAVTYRDCAKVLGPIDVFLGTSSQQMSGILRKVDPTSPTSFSSIVSSRALYRYSDMAMAERPEISEVQGAGTGSQITPPSLASLAGVVFFEVEPLDNHDYVEFVGLVKGLRVRRRIRRDYVNDPKSFDQWKVLVAKSNNNGTFGETLSGPFVGEPLLGHTDTFLSVGSFGNKSEAEACLKYVKSKFARALLGILKTTQDNPKGKWKHVPLQDFTVTSDIDWSKSIPEIDQQLYAKYGLDDEEIEFIESHVKPMD